MALLGFRHFIREYLVALSRVGRDRRARAIALRGTLLLVVYPIYNLFLLWKIFQEEGGGGQAVLAYSILAAAAYVIFRLLRRSHQQQDELLNHSLTGQVAPQLPPHEVADSVRTALSERLHIAAAFCARAHGELFLQQHGRDEQVAARETVNRFLREQGLWEKLEPEEVTLAALPDGEWPPEEVGRRATRWTEQLRLLRWTFRLDEELAPLQEFPPLDESLYAGLVATPRSDLKVALRPPWDLRHEGAIAMRYYQQVFPELGLRNLLGAAADPAACAKSRLDAGPSNDLLAGTRTIGELPDADLTTFATIVEERGKYAEYLTVQLDEPEYTPFSRFRLRELESYRAARLRRGMIAFRGPQSDFLRLLSEAGVALLWARQLAPEDEWPEDREQTFYLLGEHAGSTYLMDPSSLLSSNPDLLARVASEGRTKVVGCGWEPFSGTFWFSSFDGNRVIRRFYACHADLETPFSVGAAFASESDQPLDDDEGIAAALRESGFRNDLVLRDLYREQELIELPAGPLQQEESRYYEANRSS